MQSADRFFKAILWANTGSEHLAMAFANRSAALFDCGSFEAAITGLNRYFIIYGLE